MKKRVSFLLAAFILVISAGVFTGCNSNLDGGNEPIPIPEELKGTWVSTYGEEYTITAAMFSSVMTGYGGYTGTIVNIREDGSGAGYITIIYTKNDGDPTAIGKYYVIHYKNLTSTIMEISGAANGDDPEFAYPLGGGKATQSEAESLYTVENGYFGYYSAVTIIIPEKHTNKLQGTWTSEWDEMITITDTDIVYYGDDGFGGYMPYFGGKIVDVDDQGATGYITFQYSLNYNSALFLKYSVFYWQNYDADGEITADMAFAGNSWPGGNIGEDTKADAIAKYTAGAVEDFFDLDYISEFTKEE